ncbi:M3 family oligoendopeptidase [Paenibacillus aceris]|uniref:M3 family oligoendopeptidase n=1 Tax=Paenibacillus aceris TaxID=869555 RepID=A0ABS4HSW9_9BACL|nr:M3 family oligoendopeptidase [Paenibacillus aceris]MBP1961688.1 M3 family oligoendopeptidase [Paenibacillus aceris]NHW34452.1 M3 family oligoendopeptidase [Paenibacillus aceris]
MKFQDFTYERPDFSNFETGFKALLEQFKQAASFDEQDQAMEAIVKLRGEQESMESIARIRHTVDTTDEFYKAEQEYFDEIEPLYQGLITEFYKALIDSAYRAELEVKWGKQLFRIAALALQTFSPAIVEDLVQENKLASEYSKLLASAKLVYAGEERNLSQLVPFQLSTDRNIRKESNDVKYSFFIENEAKLDELYDQLVKIRTEIAKKLGYNNFVELAYARMSRSDYNANDVEAFRNQVLEHIVPAAAKLKERQKARIGVDALHYYDDKFGFPSGNATPKGDADWIVEQARKMYAELSPETDEFFTFMIDNGLMDLVAKKGKRVGGYCSYISSYKAPFIFSNFNGTAGDIDVLTHEVGHAFQGYCSREFQVPEYVFPTLEACEIHSMSMEFLAWPWMSLFFEDETDKYKFKHLSESLLFIPYGVAVDEFQHRIYEQPELSPAERKRVWREIERKYLPHRVYEDNDYLERGGFWQQQPHIYKSPFYYIDYTLAQVCAFQFWKRANENPELAWQDYLRLCQQGGSQSFTELVQVANLISPFHDGCVASVIGHIENWLNQVDDKAL